jgi:Rhodanese-like domain
MLGIILKPRGGDTMIGGSRQVLCALLALTFVVAFSVSVMAKDVPRMTIDELKSLLGKPEVVIIDVRAGADWSASSMKIQGAVREEPNKADTWMNKYPKDKTIVLY